MTGHTTATGTRPKRLWNNLAGPDETGQLNPARVFLCLSAIVWSVNLAGVFQLEKARPLEVGTYLATFVAIAVRGRMDRRALRWAALVVFGTLISAMLTVNPGFSWDVYVRALASVSLPLLVFCVVPNREDATDFLRFYAFLPLLSSAIGIVYQLTGTYKLFPLDPSGVPRFAASVIPAFIGGASASGLFASLMLIGSGRNFYFWIAGANAVVLLLSGGRMAAFAGFLVAVAAYLWGFKRAPMQKVVLTLLGLVGGLVAAVTVAATLIDRATSGKDYGREMLANYIWSFVDYYPLMGIGLGHQGLIMERTIVVKTGTIAAHNEYLRILVECGYVGGTVVAIGFAGMILSVWASWRIGYSPLLAFAVLSYGIYTATDNTIGRIEMLGLLAIALYSSGLPARMQTTSRTSRAPRRAVSPPPPGLAEAPPQASTTV